MIVDGHVTVGSSLFGEDLRYEVLLLQMDELGIDRALICPAKPSGYALRVANEAVAAAVDASDGRLRGWARVDPWRREEAVAEARWALSDANFQGLFLHPWEETFDIGSDVVDPVVAVAEEHAVPVLIAAGFPWLSEILQIAALAARFPQVQFIATNAGQLNISGLSQIDCERALERCQNLAVQTCGMYREDFLERVVRRFGAERLMFASGAPRFSLEFERDRINESNFDDPAKETIFAGRIAARFIREDG